MRCLTSPIDSSCDFALRRADDSRCLLIVSRGRVSELPVLGIVLVFGIGGMGGIRPAFSCSIG